MDDLEIDHEAGHRRCDATTGTGLCDPLRQRVGGTSRQLRPSRVSGTEPNRTPLSLRRRTGQRCGSRGHSRPLRRGGDAPLRVNQSARPCWPVRPSLPCPGPGHNAPHRLPSPCRTHRRRHCCGAHRSPHHPRSPGRHSPKNANDPSGCRRLVCLSRAVEPTHLVLQLTSRRAERIADGNVQILVCVLSVMAAVHQHVLARHGNVDVYLTTLALVMPP
jgi:hypothetical protein